MLDKDNVAREEEQLRVEVRGLDEHQRAAYYSRFEQEVKDPDTYAVLNYLFITGLHHFYLGKWQRGAVNLTLFIVAVLIMFMGLVWVGITLIAVVTLIELYALFRSQLIVQNHNNLLMRRLLSEVKATSRDTRS